MTATVCALDGEIVEKLSSGHMLLRVATSCLTLSVKRRSILFCMQRRKRQVFCAFLLLIGLGACSDSSSSGAGGAGGSSTGGATAGASGDSSTGGATQGGASGAGASGGTGGSTGGSGGSSAGAGGASDAATDITVAPDGGDP